VVVHVGIVTASFKRGRSVSEFVSQTVTVKIENHDFFEQQPLGTAVAMYESDPSMMFMSAEVHDVTKKNGTKNEIIMTVRDSCRRRESQRG